MVDLKTMLRLGDNRHDGSGWTVPVLATSSQKQEGMAAALVAAIDAHRAHLETSGEIAERRRKIAEMRILKTAEEIVRERMGRRGEAMAMLVGQVAEGQINPYTAAHELVDDSTSS